MALNDDRNVITINKKITLDFRLSEAYKTLRTNIEFSVDDIKVVCVTSATPNEGKSSISFDGSTYDQAGRLCDPG